MVEEVQYADFGVRFAAFLIDSMINSLVLFLLNLLGLVGLLTIFWIFYFSFLHASSHQATIGKKICGLKVCSANLDKISLKASFLRTIFPIAFSIVSLLIIMLILTIPKLFIDYPMDVDGLSATIYLLSIFVVYGAIFFDPKKRGLHDIFCKTLVIYSKKAP